jgi:histidine ammonia-lyase
MPTLVLNPGALTLDDIQAIHAGGVQVAIDKSADAAIAAASTPASASSLRRASAATTWRRCNAT